MPPQHSNHVGHDQSDKTDNPGEGHCCGCGERGGDQQERFHTFCGQADLLGLFFASLLGLSGITRQAAIVEASVPTAVLAMVLATEYDTAPRFTASVVMVSTLASLVTMTLVLIYLR